VERLIVSCAPINADFHIVLNPDRYRNHNKNWDYEPDQECGSKSERPDLRPAQLGDEV
jgi:hypothetical protein